MSAISRAPPGIRKYKPMEDFPAAHVPIPAEIKISDINNRTKTHLALSI